jgi:hypothetical protein
MEAIPEYPGNIIICFLNLIDLVKLKESKAMNYFSDIINSRIKNILENIDRKTFKDYDLNYLNLRKIDINLTEYLMKKLRNEIVMKNSIQKIAFPNNLEYIYQNAFLECENIKSIFLPENIKNIGDGSFARCFNLTNINFPSGLKSIGNGAFFNCINLKGNINLQNKLEHIGRHAFCNCYKIEKVIIPYKVKELNSHTFYSCKNLKEAIIKNGLKKIGDNCFGFCQNLSNLSLPHTIEYIGNYAFSECSTLSTINMPYVENVGLNIFGVKYFTYSTHISTIFITSNFSNIDLIDIKNKYNLDRRINVVIHNTKKRKRSK